MTTTPIEPRSIETIVGECAGAVSACWEDLNNAGTFQSSQAQQHVEAAIAEIKQVFEIANARLLEVNRGLANQLQRNADKLDEGRRELLATGWDACADLPTRPDKTANPYRRPVPDFSSGFMACKMGNDA